MTDRKLTAEELHQLTRAWFSEARAKSEQDAAEVASWDKAHRKWTHYGGGAFTSGWDSGSDGGGDGGGD